MEVVSTPTVRFELGRDGMVRSVQVHPLTTPTEEIVRTDAPALRRLVRGRELPLLWDLRGAPRVPASLWKVLVEELPPTLSAMAAVLDQQSGPLGSFPSIMNSLLVPFAAFHDEQEAVLWLKGHDRTAGVQEP